MSKFIVYCDESSHTDPQKRNFFAIGSLWIPWEAKPTVNQEIKRIKVDNGLRGEMKWKNVSDLYFKPYADIVDYFFANHDLRFRAILVDQWKVKYSKYHDGDKELGFYKFYYHMLYQWLERGNDYLILLDFKSNKGARRFADLKSALKNKVKGLAEIVDLTIIDSKQSHIVQLCDVLTGVVAAAYNNDIRRNSPKERMAQYIAAKLNWSSLCKATARSDQKFNLFKIDLDRHA